jgi:hypothetical protein
MPAGASSGVAVVTAGSARLEMGAFAPLTNSAMGICSVPEPLGMLDLPQLQGAYHDPFRTDDAVKKTFVCPVAPVLHLAD